MVLQFKLAQSRDWSFCGLVMGAATCGRSRRGRVANTGWQKPSKITFEAMI